MHSFGNIVKCVQKSVTWLAAAEASIASNAPKPLSDFHKTVSTTVTNMIASANSDGGWSSFHESYTHVEGSLQEDLKSLLVDGIRCVCVHCLRANVSF